MAVVVLSIGSRHEGTADVAGLAWSTKGKVTRRERFLAKTDVVIPWARLIRLIEPHYPRAGNRRQPLRVGKDAANLLPAAVVRPRGPGRGGCAQIEIHFSILQRKALTPADFASLETAAQRIPGFEQHHQQIAQPFEWRFTRRDLARLANRSAQHQYLHAG